MCGFAGILHRGAISDAPQLVKRMADALVHRGPDDEGFWHGPDCALGFRRLAIVDLAGGHQPMQDRSGDVVVVFNGEIYNHRELRCELEALGYAFSTDHSDTEVLVQGWKAWKESLPARLNGMFAFAVWDRRERSLFLARDRYGIKPLYSSLLPSGSVVFGSEIRAIHASGLIPKAMNHSAVLEYFSHQNLWGETTFFRDVAMFPAATWVKFSPDSTTLRKYWDYKFVRDSRLSLEDAALEHREILQRVIERQVAADVPVMSYLSGGIDSSALSAAAHRLDPTIKTYACIFELENVGDDRIVDEREFSRLVSQRLGTRHLEMQISANALEGSLLPTISALEDPRMGMAYVNELIAGRVAQDGKVVLSGTGGDEIHGGYVYRYQATALSPCPRFSSLHGLAFRMFGGKQRDRRRATENFHRIVNFLLPENERSRVFTPEFLKSAGEYSADAALDSLLEQCPSENMWDRVMYVDARTYLHGLLVMEDKLSMWHSLEARVPLLDNELVDFVCRLPWRYLFDGTTGKLVFRESVKPWLPPEVYAKPKMGFGPPDASWYRGKLRPFIESKLSRQVIEKQGVFRPEFVESTLTDHFSGKANRLPMIWSLLSFSTWHDLHGFGV